MPSPAAPPAAELLARSVESFLAEHPHAAIFEDGRLFFDLRLAHCSVTADHGRCLLHLWSDEKNTVRTISAVQPRRETLRLETRRFGQAKAQTLTLVPDPSFRTSTARDTARRRYLRTLEQALTLHFPGWTPEGFRSAMDLEHSFGPAYARGILTKGQSCWAVLGVGPEELPAVVDGALTLGILWLDYCRTHGNGRRVFHGLRLVVPAGCAAVARSRMAWLNPALAQWELYELHPSTAELTACPIGDDGNLAIQLPHAFDPQAALDRSATAIAHLRSLLPPSLLAVTEIRPRAATEVAFSLHGLEYARIRHGLVPGSFTHRDEIFFGAGANGTLLDDSTEDLFRDLMDALLQGRNANGAAGDPLYRLQPERWLESVLRRDLSLLSPDLGAGPVYSQMFAACPERSASTRGVEGPAFSISSRTLLDLVTVNRHGRLVILELKADDDLHLPLQALDYWIRIRALHRAGEIARRGYFPGVECLPTGSPDTDPLLCCVAPALHIHPANETIFRALSPAVPWEFIALDEHWRTECRVVLRKHPKQL
ncbi:MAG TPA: hypothetical protein VL990_13040 [Acidobacteriaceae bacterium]|nr:hypothetical protein [Acidobacteriaceae bacterium]